MMVGVWGPPRSSMPNFKSLASDLLAILLRVSIASSKESRRTSWFLTGVKEDFDIVVGVWGPPRCSMPNFKPLVQIVAFQEHAFLNKGN